MKLGKLVDPQFQAALRKLSAQDIPLRAAFSLRGIIKRCNEELAKYDEVRNSALNALGDKDAEGKLAEDPNGNVKLSEENMKKFISELNVLLATDVNVGSVKFSDLGDKLSLTTNELIALDEVVTD